MDLSEVKVFDFAKTKELVAGSRMKILRAYQNKFFFNGGKQGSVIFHVILATGIIGYSLEYNHLSNLLIFCKILLFIYKLFKNIKRSIKVMCE
jgi:type IV secretory pathway TrbD component